MCCRFGRARLGCAQALRSIIAGQPPVWLIDSGTECNFGFLIYFPPQPPKPRKVTICGHGHFYFFILFPFIAERKGNKSSAHELQPYVGKCLEVPLSKAPAVITLMLLWLSLLELNENLCGDLVPVLQSAMCCISCSHTLSLLLCVLTLTPTATGASPETLCGAELVDTLQFVCGERGFYFSKCTFLFIHKGWLYPSQSSPPPASS